MSSIIAWVNKNKLSSLVLLILLLLFGRQLIGSFPAKMLNQSMAPVATFNEDAVSEFSAASMGVARSKSILPPVSELDTPRADISDRLVVQESNLSLVVNNVRQSVDQIIAKAQEDGGYMVSSSLNQPEEAPFATVVVRVPAEQLDQVLEYYRSLAIKVSSENLTGHDVTDQYLDIETRLERLRKTQAKFEQLLDQATNFDQILQAQREILNLQDQIDNYIGRQQYLEQTAKLAKLTIYLSTDELALPYAPSETFRPLVTVKLAFRSLVLTVRSVIKLLIWVAIYGAIWIPAIIIFKLLHRWWKNRQKLNPPKMVN